MVSKEDMIEGELYFDMEDEIYLICGMIELHPDRCLADEWTMYYIRDEDAGINKYYAVLGICYLESALNRLRKAEISELAGELL